MKEKIINEKCQIEQFLAHLAVMVREQNFNDSAQFVIAIINLIILGVKIYLGVVPDIQDIIGAIGDFKTIFEYIGQIIENW